MEALKCLLGAGDLLVGRLLQLDLRTMTVHVVRFDRRADCAACSVSGASAAARRNGADAPAEDVEPGELVRRLHETSIQLIDVREPNEREINQIPGSILIPKGDFQTGEALAKLPNDKPSVFYCKVGGRSAEVLAIAKGAGFADAVHVGGGVSAWVNQVDPSQPAY